MMGLGGSFAAATGGETATGSPKTGAVLAVLPSIAAFKLTLGFRGETGLPMLGPKETMALEK